MNDVDKAYKFAKRILKEDTLLNQITEHWQKKNKFLNELNLLNFHKLKKFEINQELKIPIYLIKAYQDLKKSTKLNEQTKFNAKLIYEEYPIIAAKQILRPTKKKKLKEIEGVDEK